MEATRVRELFDALSLEVYYGFNMKLEMMNLSEDTIKIFENFVTQCQNARKYNPE